MEEIVQIYDAMLLCYNTRRRRRSKVPESYQSVSQTQINRVKHGASILPLMFSHLTDRQRKVHRYNLQSHLMKKIVSQQ